MPRDVLEYRFVIPGACPPKGSKVPVRKGSSAMREASTRVEPWTEGALRCMRDRLGKPLARFEGPVYVGATFVFKRPKVTEFEFPTAPSIGDLDKLLRCLNDALVKAGVIEDDRFIVEFPGPPKKIWGEQDQTLCVVGSMVRGPEVTTFNQPEREFLPVVPNPYIDHHECVLVQIACADAGCPVHVPPMP